LNGHGLKKRQGGYKRSIHTPVSNSNFN
jgi:hypothetical protein